MVMEQLQRLDQVAYVRFASVYRQFKDINQFMDEVKGLLKDDKSKPAPARQAADSGGPRGQVDAGRHQRGAGQVIDVDRLAEQEPG